MPSFRRLAAGLAVFLCVAVPGCSDKPKLVTVTGRVTLKLYKGNLMTAGRKSPVSLYNPAIATMEADPTKAYNQDDATGFIRLNALRLKVAAKVQKKNKFFSPKRLDWISLD